MELLISVIRDLGFPIACVVGMGWFITYVIKFILNELIENRKTIHLAVETISRFNEKFNTLEDKVDKVLQTMQEKE